MRTVADPWQEWLNAVGYLSLPEIRCDVIPSQEILDMIDAVGLGVWESYTIRLERHIVRDHWTWPERTASGDKFTT